MSDQLSFVLVKRICEWKKNESNESNESNEYQKRKECVVQINDTVQQRSRLECDRACEPMFKKNSQNLLQQQKIGFFSDQVQHT